MRTTPIQPDGQPDFIDDRIGSNALMGLETEYAFTPFGHDGRALDRTVYSQRLVSLAARHYPSLYGRNEHDLFLANGGRLYVDSGCGLINIEYSTPECTRPEELIAHVRAGDRLLAGLARELEGQEPELESAFISKCNFDYSGHTSGSHENYLHTVPQSTLAPQLIPHLVSRIIYTGGGGFDDSSPMVEFLLSPRVRFLEHVSSRGAQNDRAIFTNKQEPLSNSRYGRLHLLCSEGVRFDLADYLRFAVTALIVRLIDSGLSPADGIDLNPLPAIRTIARDIGCRHKIGRIDGVPANAIDVQRHYLSQVQVHVGRPYLPDWAGSVCKRWEATLEGLETDPMQFVGILDWPTKLGLYRSFAEQRGFEWRRLTREEHESRREIRDELFEFDVRFGDISDTGPFTALAHDSRPENKLVTDIAIEDALCVPPQGTRAKLRGKWVERLGWDPQGKRCEWGSICDENAKRLLRFDNPFGLNDVRWVRCSRP